MLLDLDKRLRPDELDTLKYLCKDFIPVRRLEVITRALNLWEVLEERDRMGPDSVEFLKTLLKDGTSREDLVKSVTEYEQKTRGIIHEPDSSRRFHKDFDIISENVNIRKWRTLARKLGLSDVVIDGLAEKYQGDVREQIRRALTLWSTTENATEESLLDALRSCDMNMIAHELVNSRTCTR